jgi:EAL domain-containing protein (putative c-di-GMP-specific phosphodiesterase class I)
MQRRLDARLALEQGLHLSYLKRFPVDKLKIDQSFTRALSIVPEDGAIVAAVIQLAHSLGLRAVAEGVETEAQLRLLAEEGCDEIQGYYFSRPLPERDMVAMLRARTFIDLAGLDITATATRAKDII